MFRRFAYQGMPAEMDRNWQRARRERAGWQEPQGPWNARMHRMRGLFGGPAGPGDRERFFGRGDMKFALLALLQERPMYGYEMIKALEEKSGGFYTPSPGSIYPTLQMLEERGAVTAQETEGKKVYSITEVGIAILDEHQQKDQFAGPPWSRQRGGRGERERGLRMEIHALRSESMEVARLFSIAGRSAVGDPTQMARLRGIIERTRKELSDMLYGEATPPPPPPPVAPDLPDVD